MSQKLQKLDDGAEDLGDAFGAWLIVIAMAVVMAFIVFGALKPHAVVEKLVPSISVTQARELVTDYAKTSNSHVKEQIRQALCRYPLSSKSVPSDLAAAYKQLCH